MPWEPDPELRQLLENASDGIREPRMVELQRREWRSIEHQFAARGALGGALTAALRDAAERGVEEIGNEFVGTILPRIVE